jgi:N-methylhydantoinase A
MGYRVTADVGGTFTDVVVSDASGRLEVGKAPTDHERASAGLHAALEVAGRKLGLDARALLRAADLFIYSTTRSTNAILEGKTARTAFITTAGFPDILVLREGGKTNPFDFNVPSLQPYVPRALTFEAPERIDAEGGIVTPLDEAAVAKIADALRTHEVEAVGVSLLWSFVNPRHELRIGEILAERLPDVAVTLSHQLSPVIREYRRASATVIDASLKPLMEGHLRAVESDLRELGFRGELLGATIFGGVMHFGDLAARPIYSASSGPSMAPVAGRVFAAQEAGAKDAIVCDMGGTSFDVSLVRDGQVNYARETWLGDRFVGHLVAIPSVDVRSVGAGGGSIAWIDPGGLLRVGPESAGAAPGPACYGRGGDRPTVTDAALLLGYLDPGRFLGGRMTLDSAAARRVMARLGEALGLTPEAAASAVLAIASEHLVGAVREVTVDEGIDPRDCLLVAGGGAAGLSMGRIARELGCARFLAPRTAGALSALGAQYSDVIAEATFSLATSSDAFDFAGVAQAFAGLEAQLAGLRARLEQRGATQIGVQHLVQARYATQLWDLEIPLPTAAVASAADLQALAEAFGREHARVYAIRDPNEPVHFLAWKARLRADVGGAAAVARQAQARGGPRGEAAPAAAVRRAYFDETGWREVPVYAGGSLAPGDRLEGPAVVAEETSTLMVYPGDVARVTAQGDYLIDVAGAS